MSLKKDIKNVTRKVEKAGKKVGKAATDYVKNNADAAIVGAGLGAAECGLPAVGLGLRLRRCSR